MMGGREFIVPTDEELLSSIGVQSEPVDGDTTVRRLQLNSPNGDILAVTYDVLATSVQVHWMKELSTVLDIVREGARRMVVEPTGGDTLLRITFETEGLRGELTVQLWPQVTIRDHLLIV